LLQLLVVATCTSKYEVQSRLQDLSYECFNKVDAERVVSSWTKAKYPGISIFLRITVWREGHSLFPHPDIISGEIKGNVQIDLFEKNTHFSSKQVEEFLVDKILLGAKQ